MEALYPTVCVCWRLKAKWLTLLFSEYKTFICWAKLVKLCPHLDLQLIKWKNIVLNVWKNASTKNSGRRRLFFVNAIFTYLEQIFKTIFFFKFIQINLRSRCGQSFTDFAQQMNVLYSAEQKGRPLCSQALSLTQTKINHIFWTLPHICLQERVAQIMYKMPLYTRRKLHLHFLIACEPK